MAGYNRVKKMETNRNSKCFLCRFLKEGKCTLPEGKEICDASFRKAVEKKARIKWENEFVEPVIRQLKTEAYDLIREKYLYQGRLPLAFYTSLPI